MEWTNGRIDGKKEDDTFERREPDRGAKDRWSIEVYDSFFYLLGLQGL